jgi:hypothetical protein
MFELTVIQDFGTYRRGDAITDPATVAKILDSEQASNVVKVAAGTHIASEPVEEPKAAAKPKADAKADARA